MSDNISIAGLDKAAVLIALYKRAQPQGMGFLQYTEEPMSMEEANQLLSTHKYFDYLRGRVMKVSLEGDEFDPWLYDRDNGYGAAEKVISDLRNLGVTATESSKSAHLANRKAAAESAMEQLNAPSGVEKEGDGTVTFRLGLGDVSKEIEPFIRASLDD